MHLDLTNSSRVLTDWKEYTDPTQKLACLVENYGREVYFQRYNADDESDTNVREKIFSLFLNLSNSRVISMIKLKAQIEASSTQMKVKIKMFTYYYAK